MDELVRQLQAQVMSDPPPEDKVTEILRDCLQCFALYLQNDVVGELPAFLETLLKTVIKPLFSKTSKQSRYQSRFSEDSPKQWRDSAPWCLDVLRWILDQYSTLEKPLLKQTIESHLLLLVPPILTLLDDDDPVQKALGCRFLDTLSSHISSCQSEVLKRTGLTKVFEDSLAPNMLLLPSLTPEHQCLEVLGSLYPAYRSLIQASFVIGISKPSQNKAASSAAAQRRLPGSTRTQALGQYLDKQAMLDRILRNGLLAGYLHASESMQISSLLVSEMSPVVGLMGTSSAKYLQRLLPLFRGILGNPMGSAYPPLLKAAVVALRQVILQCWPRIRQVWWEECLRTVIGFWLILPGNNDDTTIDLKKDAKGLVSILLQLKGPTEGHKILQLVQAEFEPLGDLLPE